VRPVLVLVVLPGRRQLLRRERTAKHLPVAGSGSGSGQSPSPIVFRPQRRVSGLGSPLVNRARNGAARGRNCRESRPDGIAMNAGLSSGFRRAAAHRPTILRIVTVAVVPLLLRLCGG
jgi:hypothetical protein